MNLIIPSCGSRPLSVCDTFFKSSLSYADWNYVRVTWKAREVNYSEAPDVTACSRLAGKHGGAGRGGGEREMKIIAEGGEGNGGLDERNVNFRPGVLYRVSWPVLTEAKTSILCGQS